MKLGFGGLRVARVALAVVASIGACSASKDKSLTGDNGPSSGSQGASSDDGDDGTASDGGGGGGSAGSSGGLFSSTGGGSTNTGPSSLDAACASSTQKGEQQGLNAYIMLDYSGSMMGVKWTGVTDAINSFVQEASSGISVGMQYFGLPNQGDAGAIAIGPVTINIGDSCDPTVYAQPAIEIAPLPGVGSLITQSLSNHGTPNTATPTPPALQGAIQHATSWATAHPSDVTIVILATDGDPSECPIPTNSTASLLSQVEAIAASGAAQTPKVLTFVIGVGKDTANLDGIAQSGGTGSAFIVDTTQNVSQQFLAALDKIRGAALGCQYKIPVPKSGGSVNFDQVNVEFTSGGKTEVVPQVSDKGKCPSSGDAWYYDNPTSPSQILLCTTTCGTVSAGGELDVLTGCQTVQIPTK
jgi:hypothetical protein